MPRARRSQLFQYCRRSDKRVQRVSWGHHLIDVSREVPLADKPPEEEAEPEAPSASLEFEQSRSQHLSENSLAVQSAILQGSMTDSAPAPAPVAPVAPPAPAAETEPEATGPEDPLQSGRDRVKAKMKSARAMQQAMEEAQRAKGKAAAVPDMPTEMTDYLPGTTLYYGSEICVHSPHSGYLSVDSRGGCYMSETLSADGIFTLWNLDNLGDFGIVRYGDHAWLQINKDQVLGSTVMMDLGRGKTRKQKKKKNKKNKLPGVDGGIDGGGGGKDMAGRPVPINSRGANLNHAKLLGQWVLLDPFAPRDSVGQSLNHMDAVTFEQGWLFLAADGRGPMLKRRGGPEFGADVDREHFSGVWRIRLYSGSSGMTNDQLVLIEARNQLRNSEGAREKALQRQATAKDRLNTEIDAREERWRAHLVSEGFDTDSTYFQTRFVHAATGGWQLNPSDLLTSHFARRLRDLAKACEAAKEAPLALGDGSSILKEEGEAEGEEGEEEEGEDKKAEEEEVDQGVDEEGDELVGEDRVARARAEAMATSAEAGISADVWNEILQQREAQLDTMSAAKLEAAILIQRAIRKWLKEPWKRDFRHIDTEVTADIMRKMDAQQQQDAFAAKFNAEFEAEKREFLTSRRKRMNMSQRSLAEGLSPGSSLREYSPNSSTRSVVSTGSSNTPRTQRRRVAKQLREPVPELTDAEKLVLLQYIKPEVYGRAFSEELPKVFRSTPVMFERLDELTVGGPSAPQLSPLNSPPPTPSRGMGRRAQSASALHRTPHRRFARPNSGSHTMIRPVKSFLKPEPVDENGLTAWRALVRQSSSSRPASALMRRRPTSALGNGKVTRPASALGPLGAGGRPAVDVVKRALGQDQPQSPAEAMLASFARGQSSPSVTKERKGSLRVSNSGPGARRPGSAAPGPRVRSRPGSAAPVPSVARAAGGRPGSAAPAPRAARPGSAAPVPRAGGVRPGSAAPAPRAVR